MSKFFKVFVYLLVILVLSIVTTKADEEKTGPTFGGSISATPIILEAPDGTPVSLTKISGLPEIGMGPFSLGLDINAILGNKSKLAGMDTGKNSVIVKYAKYEKDPLTLKWGVVSAYTLGNGLLFKNFSTESTAKSSVTTNKDKAGSFKFKTNKFSISGMGTASTHIYAGRVTVGLSKMTLGATYVKDGDVWDDVKAMGVDLTIPVFAGSNIYAEWANLKYPTSTTTTNKGNGFTVGLTLGKEDGVLFLRNEYRKLDKEFIPGIFDAHYEDNSLSRKQQSDTSTPITYLGTGTTTQNKNGYLTELLIKYGDMLNASISYEDYEKVSPRLIAIASGEYKPKGKEADSSSGFTNIKFSGSFEQKNFSLTKVDAKENQVLKWTITTDLNKYTELVVSTTQIYQPDSTGDLKKVTSTNYGVQFKLK